MLAGKDKTTWVELMPHEVEAAKALGYGAITWDRGRTPGVANHPWSALPPPLRKAAAILGYTSREWNEDGGFADAGFPAVEEKEDEAVE